MACAHVCALSTAAVRATAAAVRVTVSNIQGFIVMTHMIDDIV